VVSGAKAVERQRVVFHLVSGSLPSSSTVQIAADFSANTAATLRLLDICRASGVGKVIFASSGGTVYGEATDFPISELAPTNPVSGYGVTKLTIEKFLLLYHRQFGLDFHVLRIGNPYGPYQSPLRKQGVVSAIIYRALSGKPVEIWGDGQVIRDFIHVNDVADAFIEAVCYAGPHRIMNVGSGQGKSINQVISDIGDLLEIKIDVIRRAGRNTDVPINILDSSLIISETNWRPRIAWFDGLRDTAAWMTEQVAL
jgi:UDP-glucose 4-epimerase